MAKKKRKKRQPVTPRQGVDDARPVDAALHLYFEWRDHVAAERYRAAVYKTHIGDNSSEVT